MKFAENQKTEFKESWQDDCLKTVAAFANTDGGILYFGISDDGFVQTSDDVEGNLFQQVDNAMTILRTKYLLSTFKYEGLYRKDILEYPEEALREAIINSVIHKDYLGPHIQMRIYQNMIDLWNQGPLPKTISVADLKRVHKSVPRNRILAETFFKAALIEGWGQGTLKITEDFIAAGFPSPKFKEQFGGVSVFFHKKEIPAKVIKSGEANNAIEGDAKNTEPSSGKTTQTTTQTTTQRILAILSDIPAVSRKELAIILGDITEDGVKYHLNKLKKNKIIVRIGSNFGGHWKIVKDK